LQIANFAGSKKGLKSVLLFIKGLSKKSVFCLSTRSLSCGLIKSWLFYTLLKIIFTFWTTLSKFKYFLS
jgi:hypothetical protein